MPTLAFDIRANHDTGVSRYGLATLAGAAPMLCDAGWDVTVVTSADQEHRAAAAVAGTAARVLCSPRKDGFVRRSPWLRELLVAKDVHLYYTSHYTVDRQCPVPFVPTIHDLTRLRFPWLAYDDLSFAQRYGWEELDLVADELAQLSHWDSPRHPAEGTFTRYFRALTRCLVERAEHVVTVSATSAVDIAVELDIGLDRISLVPCPIDTRTFTRRDAVEVASVRRSFGIDGPYLMFVGLTHPNKRLGWLLDQLLDHRSTLPADARLVAVGGFAEQAPEIVGKLSRRDASDFVVFTGRVTDDELAALYSGAAALVSASVSEGSNLPPQEALCCGTPVIATDLPVHREMLGDCALLYPPHRGDVMASYAAAALQGALRRGHRVFRPPAPADAGRGLIEALSCAMQNYAMPQPLAS